MSSNDSLIEDDSVFVPSPSAHITENDNFELSSHEPHSRDETSYQDMEFYSKCDSPGDVPLRKSSSLYCPGTSSFSRVSKINPRSGNICPSSYNSYYDSLVSWHAAGGHKLRENAFAEMDVEDSHISADAILVQIKSIVEGVDSFTRFESMLGSEFVRQFSKIKHRCLFSLSNLTKNLKRAFNARDKLIGSLSYELQSNENTLGQNLMPGISTQNDKISLLVACIGKVYSMQSTSLSSIARETNDPRISVGVADKDSEYDFIINLPSGMTCQSLMDESGKTKLIELLLEFVKQMHQEAIALLKSRFESQDISEPENGGIDISNLPSSYCSPEMRPADSLVMSSRYRTMRYGTWFIRWSSSILHKRRAKRCYAWLSRNHEFIYFTKTFPGENMKFKVGDVRQDSQIRIADIVKIDYADINGHASEYKDCGRELCEHLLFIIVLPKRTVGLQALAEDDVERWFLGINSLLKAPSYPVNDSCEFKVLMSGLRLRNNKRTDSEC